ncbi:uncharacterized protein ACA1_395520 [Acanthamoeba castellanii str. Neff]|uniref:Uncharacterized protein n=1 Tax=Acanthamoeba castellanii (strain ATCC 30010 / Neff) TaxID=1257118 RepID=L8H2V0_ACACF|nr:uncharacterized protein ACA1_395520 [Acanthamoeba castellanii str. Neff]ELR18721.1 hypothetical protein ACA1_395520 [Acanthamoeba castellanii str. Neff]
MDGTGATRDVRPSGQGLLLLPKSSGLPWATKACQANCAPQCTNPCNQVSTCPAGMRVREAPRMLLDGVAIRFSRAAFLHAICFRFSVLRAAVGHAVRDPDHLCDPVAFAVVHRALALFDAARGQRDKSRVVGCLSVSTCGAVALYYYRKKQRVEELGMPTSADNRAYAHLETEDEEGLFDGAEDDEEDLPDPFAEEFVAREMEMRQLSTSPPSPRTPSSALPPPSSSSQTAPNGNGNHFAIGDENELVVRDDPVDEVEEGVDMFAERD